MSTTNYSLLNNSRFYILAFSVLLSVVVFAWLRLHIVSDQLLFIRTQQLYGLICVIFWYVALIISPIGYVIGKQRMKKIEFARRAIGVSAFYYAFLHMAVALWGQLGGIAGLQHLPQLFMWSLIGGAVGLVILFLMALTSFDKVIAFMTFRRWKWLHRLVYIGGVLVLFHIWTVGTHLTYGGVQLAALLALILLSGLELFRLTVLMNRKLKLGRAEAGTLFIAMWSIAVLLLFVTPNVVETYHGRHAGHEQSRGGDTHRHGGRH